ncbi:MAG: sigma-70 family RNA polymerase sigma factor [Candidatus Riflebacteria bacterium]|nr:sigma-70 family RNA polymerase sigma factor [Candidatus Riflebacteria bacterium]
MTDSETDYIIRAKKGDLKAFERLVSSYQKKVFTYLFHFTGDQSNAEDLTQETFILFFRKIQQYDASRALLSWLITIAKNIAISSCRKRKPVTLAPECFLLMPSEKRNSPEDQAESRELALEVQKALQSLSEESREVLIMKYIMDFSIEEIAKHQGIPAGTAKSRLFKARSDIKNIILKENVSES